MIYTFRSFVSRPERNSSSRFLQEIPESFLPYGILRATSPELAHRFGELLLRIEGRVALVLESALHFLEGALLRAVSLLHRTLDLLSDLIGV